MESPVYFANLRSKDEKTSTVAKIRMLFDKADFSSIVASDDKIAIKLHFGETGNDSFISPVFVRQIVEKVRACGGKPFLTDTNTLYLGSRSNAVDHITTAILHGFDYAVAGAPVIIADGLVGRNIAQVNVCGKHFTSVALAGDIVASQGMIVVTHFKGHMVAGFGGALKNLAMGCAPPSGKREQHKAYPFTIPERCTACGKCTTTCPREAVMIRDAKSTIDRNLCIGCFECMTVCPERAIEVDWETEIPIFIERMVEYAAGALRGKEGKAGFISFLTRITPDCDCVPWSDTSVVPDIGILASKDPVAIDAAAYDLVNAQQGILDSELHAHHAKGGDKFQGIWKNTDGYRQILYAETLGLGSSRYELIRI